MTDAGEGARQNSVLAQLPFWRGEPVRRTDLSAMNHRVCLEEWIGRVALSPGGGAAGGGLGGVGRAVEHYI